jgi:YVTN family beta-propeller protein
VITFRLLGPLEVFDEQRPVALGGPKQRALLAVLLVHRGEAVSTDRLVDALWAEQAPASAAKIVQGYVSHLRRALGDGLLVTRGGGYLLQTAPGQVDLDRFEPLVAEGRRALEVGDARVASERLREALALWRGPPLADFAYERFAQAEIARLEEARLAALEDRIDADLAFGEHAQLVSELESLVHQHPLRERLQAQLMLALYRCGRQADALERYQQARRELVEVGVEPGRVLRELERAILAQDPALDARPTRRTTRVARSRRGPALLALGGALLLAAAVAAATVALTRGGGGSSVTVPANAVAVIDPTANRVVSEIPVGVAPDSIAAGVGGIWVANTADHSVSHIDPASRAVVGTRGFGDVDGVAADTRAVWMVDSTRGMASRLDPALWTAGPPVALGERAGVSSSPNALAVSNGTAWVANNASQVVRIGPGRRRLPIDVGNDPSGIAVGRDATWVADDSDGTVSRIDSTGAVTASTQVGPGASGIASGAGAVWVVDTLADRLVRIDPATDAVTSTIGVGRSPRGVAVGAASVWVANSGDGTISRVDPRMNRVSATIRIGHSPQAVVVSRGAVWVSVDASPSPPPSSSAGPAGVLRIVRGVPFASTDPALNGNTVDLQALQLYYATCAGLLSYPDRPALEGTRLVPDVAKAMPRVSADGRTYTFIVRRGFRFSPPSGAPVTAATFKHTIERALGPKLKGYASNVMGDIVGMTAFRKGRAARLAGVRASGDRLRIRLVAPAPDFRTRIATLFFCASPDDTPATPQPLSQPIPSAGPYYVTSASRDQVVVKRNPNYGGRRPRIAKEIVYSSGVRLLRALDRVAAGRSDDVNTVVYTNSSGSASARMKVLEDRYGPESAAARTGHQRYFVNPWQDVEYFVLNTNRSLFASARMRRAVNYAIDRRALVQHHFLFNGRLATDHYLVPGIPGWRPFDIYPLGGPNLSKARRLAGRVHAHAAMYTCAPDPQCTEEARIVQADLAKIGITVDITRLPFDRLFARLAKPGEPWDIGASNWLADFPDPFTMINELFDPASPFDYGRFNDPAWVKRMRDAARLTGKRRLQAYGRLDRDLTRNAAPVAAWGIGTVREFFSARVRCQVWQPIYGFDLGSFCLRR